MKKIVAAFFVLFFLSRVYFLTPQPIFFDSQEYSDRISNPSFSNALLSGHMPLHIGYVLFTWPLFHLATRVGFPAIETILGVQIIVSFLGVYAFYHVVKRFFSSGVALKSSVLVSLLPLFWITNMTVMMEVWYISFFLISLALFVAYLTSKKQRLFLLLVSGVFLGCAFLVHMAVILWLPLFVFFIFFYKRKQLVTLGSFLLIVIGVFSLINGRAIGFLTNTDIFEGTKLLYTSKLSERAVIELDITSVLRVLRNVIIPLLRNNTTLVVLLGMCMIVASFTKEKKTCLLGLLWVFPAVIANQWWDSLFIGRHALISSFGFALLIGRFLSGKWYLFCIAYLLFVSLPALFLLREQTPYLMEADVLSKLQKGGLYVGSHFARPQEEGRYQGKEYFADEAGGLEEEIRETLRRNKPVFVSSQALSEPYGLYAGPYVHALTLSYNSPFTLQPVLEKFTLRQHRILSKKDNLLFYRVVKNTPSSYPRVPSLLESRRRLDFFDPFTQGWFFLRNAVFSHRQ